MRTILIILGILACINILIITVSKVFADDINLDLKSDISITKFQ